MSNADSNSVGPQVLSRHKDVIHGFTGEELVVFNKRSREMERELSKAAEAGLFLTAKDLSD